MVTYRFPTLRSLGLRSVCLKKLKAYSIGAEAKEYGLDAKKDMWRLPALFVGQYAERDAESTLKLWKRLETELYQQELWDVFNLETKEI